MHRFQSVSLTKKQTICFKITSLEKNKCKLPLSENATLKQRIQLMMEHHPANVVLVQSQQLESLHLIVMTLIWYYFYEKKKVTTFVTFKDG